MNKIKTFLIGLGSLVSPFSNFFRIFIMIIVLYEIDLLIPTYPLWMKIFTITAGICYTIQPILKDIIDSPQSKVETGQEVK